MQKEGYVVFSFQLQFFTANYQSRRGEQVDFKDLIARLMMADLEEEMRTATINIKVDRITHEIEITTKNVSSSAEFIGYLQSSLVEYFKALDTPEEKAIEIFGPREVVTMGYKEPKYLKINGKDFKEDK